MQEILFSVGKRHAALGICVSYFPYLGNALMLTLEETLGTWSAEDRAAWEDVYEVISSEMMKAMLEDD